MFCMRPSPSSGWFASNFSALINFSQALRHCMRLKDLGLVNTFACVHHQEPVRWLPVVFFSTDRTPPTCMLFLQRPPYEVFHRETVTMRTQVRHRSASLSSRWRNDASQVICTFNHDFFHGAQLSCLIQCYRLKGFLYSVKISFRGFHFSSENAFIFLPSLLFSAR